MKKIPLLVFYCVLTPILIVALVEGVASLVEWARKQQPKAQIPHISEPEPKDSAPTLRLSQASYFEAGVLCAIEAWSLDAQDPPFGGGTKLRIGWLRGALVVASNSYPPRLTACLTNLPVNRELIREAGLKP